MNVLLKKWQQSRWIEMPALPEGELLRANQLAKKGLVMGMRLAVLEEQAAAIVAEGRLVGVFLPGAYQLEEDKMPHLTPDPKYDWRFPAEVLFLNLSPFNAQPWRPLAPLLTRDPELGLLQLELEGTFDAQVDNAPLFLQKMVVEHGYRSWQPIHEWLVSRLSEIAISLAARKHIHLHQLDQVRDQAACTIRRDINQELKGLGLEIRSIGLQTLTLHPNMRNLTALAQQDAEHQAYNYSLMRSILG